MNSTSPSILVATLPDGACVKISGKANFTTSLDFKRLISELSQKSRHHFVLDLTDCVTMDSTFLGVLSGMALRFFQPNGSPVSSANGHVHVQSNGANNGQPVVLVNPNPRIYDLLENLGVVHLFKVLHCQSPLDQTVAKPFDCKEESKLEVTRNCLEAHKFLMSICPENVAKFKDVTQYLSEDLRKLE